MAGSPPAGSSFPASTAVRLTYADAATLSLAKQGLPFFRPLLAVTGQRSRLVTEALHLNSVNITADGLAFDAQATIRGLHEDTQWIAAGACRASVDMTW